MGQTSPRDEEFNPKMDTDVLWYFFFSPQRTDSRNIREELPPESSDVGDVWCWSSSMQGSSLSTLHPRLDISSGGEACSESVLHISRTCLGTQRFWPSRRSVSWFFRETRESTSWNGEFFLKKREMCNSELKSVLKPDQTLCLWPGFSAGFDACALNTGMLTQHVLYSWVTQSQSTKAAPSASTWDWSWGAACSAQMAAGTSHIHRYRSEDKSITSKKVTWT